MSDIDKYAINYNAMPFEDKLVKIRRDCMLKSLGKYPFDSIAEIGCGEDPLFLHIDDYAKMIVVEPLKSFFNNAKLKSNNDPRIYMLNDYLEACYEQIKEHKIDVLILSSLLHEVPDPQVFLHSAKKICTSDTIIHINVSNAESVHRIMAKEMGLIKDEYQFSEMNIRMKTTSIYSMKTLRQEVENAGFEVFEHGSYFVKPFTHAQMQHLIDIGIMTDSMLNGLIGLEKYMPGLGSEIFVNCRMRH